MGGYREGGGRTEDYRPHPYGSDEDREGFPHDFFLCARGAANGHVAWSGHAKETSGKFKVVLLILHYYTFDL